MRRVDDENLISQLDRELAVENQALVKKCLKYADDKKHYVERRQELVYRLIEYLLHFGEYDEAEKILSRYQKLGDWSGFRLLRIKKELRTEIGSDLTELTNMFEKRIENWIDIEQEGLLLAELDYRSGRTKQHGGDMKDPLKRCHKRINSYLPTTSIEKIESLMLGAIVSLHLDRKQRKEIVPENPDVEKIIKVLEKVDQYLKTSKIDWESEQIIWNDKSHLLKIWHPDDRKYVSLCVAQANGEVEKARALLDSLIESELEFRGLDLLKKRQTDLEKNDLEKKKEEELKNKPVKKISESVLPSGWYLASVEDCGTQHRLILLDADGNVRRYDDETPVDNLYVHASKELGATIRLVKLPKISRDKAQKRVVELEPELICQVSALVYRIGNNAFRSSRFEWKTALPDFVEDLDWNILVYLQATDQLVGPLQLDRRDETEGIGILRANRKTLKVSLDGSSFEGTVELGHWSYLSEYAYQKLEKRLSNGTPFYPTNPVIQNLQELNSSIKEVGQQFQESIDKVVNQDNTTTSDAILKLHQNQTELQKLSQEVKESTELYRSDVAEVLKRLAGNQTITPKRSLSRPKIDDDFDSVDEKTFINALREVITDRGLFFPDEAIVNFHTCMKVDNFTIITGLPGSGKSSLAEVYAEVLGATSGNGRYLFLPIQPRWSDDTDLLGYFNDLRGWYEHTDLSELLRFAAEDPKHAYVVCLDEMNLARVEHYFSCFLSVFQRDEDKRQIRLFSSEKESRYDYPQTIDLSAGNVFFVGTVNQDESTVDFTNRLLDRANLIELEIGHDSFEKSLETSMNKIFNLSSPPAISMKTFKAFAVDKSKWILEDDEISFLKKINGILAETRLDIHFAHRVPQQIAKFVANFKSYDLIDYGRNERHLSERHLALDIQICQRILTKVRGSANYLYPSEKRTNNQTSLDLLNNALKGYPLSKKLIEKKIRQAREGYVH